MEYSGTERAEIIAALAHDFPQAPLACPRCGNLIYPPPVPLAHGDLAVRCKHCDGRTFVRGEEYRSVAGK